MNQQIVAKASVSFQEKNAKTIKKLEEAIKKGPIPIDFTIECLKEFSKNMEELITTLDSIPEQEKLVEKLRYIRLSVLSYIADLHHRKVNAMLNKMSYSTISQPKSDAFLKELIEAFIDL